MNAIGIDVSTSTSIPVAVELDAIGPDGDGDKDWLEFLSLGLATDPFEPPCTGRWRRAPVLLAY